MAGPAGEVLASKRKSLWWYAPIVLVLTAGYGLGGAFSFGTAYLGWFPTLSDSTGRFCLQLPPRPVGNPLTERKAPERNPGGGKRPSGGKPTGAR